MYSLCDHVGLAYMIRVFMSSYSLHCLSNKKVGIFNTTHNLNPNKANEKGYVNDFSNKLKFKALSPSVTIGGFFLSFCWCEIFMAGLNTGWSSKVSISTKKKKKDAYLFCFYSCYSCLFTLQFIF